MLSGSEKRIISALAEALIPIGRFFPAGGPAAAERIEGLLTQSTRLSRVYRVLLRILETAPVLLPPFRRFSRMPLEERESVLYRWMNGGRIRMRAAPWRPRSWPGRGWAFFSWRKDVTGPGRISPAVSSRALRGSTVTVVSLSPWAMRSSPCPWEGWWVDPPR